MSNEHLLWVEKYRPHKVADCILPDEIKKPFLAYVEKGEIPNLLLSGSAGTGKTTIAKALCEEVGCDYIVINGSLEGRNIDILRTTIKNYASAVSLAGGRKVIIIDEADYMNATTVQPALRGAIEDFASNCSIIFTCNQKSRIMSAIQSRCANVDFKISGKDKAKMASQFFKRVEWILGQEGITYDKEAVAALITKYFPDNRRILNELQRYSACGTIDKGILVHVSTLQIQDLIKALREKDFACARKWVTNTDIDVSIYRVLYDNMYDYLKPESIPQAVLILSKYQYQSAFAADQEINLAACIVEMLCDCEFK